jgi:hypothetical protein
MQILPIITIPYTVLTQIERVRGQHLTDIVDKRSDNPTDSAYYYYRATDTPPPTAKDSGSPVAEGDSAYYYYQAVQKRSDNPTNSAYYYYRAADTPPPKKQGKIP